MKYSKFLLCSLLVFISAPTYADEPKLVIGTYQKGNDVTEPKPQKSQYLETKHGGIVVVGDKAGYYLFTKVIRNPEKELYVTVEYENPRGGTPLTNDMPFKPDAEALHFSAPDFIQGLKSYGTYEITVRIFDSKESTTPIDTLTQKVRSYVDTQGAKTKLLKRLKQKQ
jgi:hypothetical protein